MRRLYGLDALRGVAALVVAIHHLSIIAGGRGLGILPSFAVDLFFVISGFVMARTYEERLRNGMTTAGFVAIRYRRLFLPLFIGTTLGLLWRHFGHLPAYVLALAFMPAFWLPNAFLFNVPAWSLFLEIVANALHGAALAKAPFRALVALFAICCVAAVFLLFVGLGHWDYGIGPILSCFPRELAFYLVGIILFRRWGDAPVDFKVPPATASWLGALSYPLYATHVPVLHLTIEAGVPPLLAFGCAGAVAVAIAATTGRHVRRKRALYSAAEGPPVSGHAA